MSASGLKLSFRDIRKHTQQLIKSSSAFAVSQALNDSMCETIQTGSTAVLLIRIRCKTCQLIFYLCRSCFRGQVYCCDGCRSVSTRKAHRQAQSLYRTSDKGRQANRIAAKRRRMKKREKSVADEGSIPQANYAMLPPASVLKKVVCLFCGISGRVVAHFPRRGYSSRFAAGDPVFTNKAGLIESKPISWRRHEKNIRFHANSPDP